jgi:hypothetical protein
MELTTTERRKAAKYPGEIPFCDQSPLRDYIMLWELPSGCLVGDSGIVIPTGSGIDGNKYVVVEVGPGRHCEVDPEKHFKILHERGDVVVVGSPGGAMKVPVRTGRVNFIMVFSTDIASLYCPAHPIRLPEEGEPTRGTTAGGDGEAPKSKLII